MNKFFLLICILTFAVNTYACKVENLDNSTSHIESAKTVVVGEVIGSGESLEFVSRLPWPVIKAKISSEICVGLKVIPGRKYILTSDKNISELNKLVLEERTAILSQMAEGYDFKTKLALRSDLPPKQMNIFWGSCMEDRECVVSRDVCGGRVGVHKKFLKNLLTYNKLNPKKDCTVSPAIKNEKAKCVEYFCR